MNTATITSQFQITIPAWIRKKMNLKAGDKLDFMVRPDGSAVMQPKKFTDISQLQGYFAKYKKNHPQPLTKDELESTWTERFKRNGK